MSKRFHNILLIGIVLVQQKHGKLAFDCERTVNRMPLSLYCENEKQRYDQISWSIQKGREKQYFFSSKERGKHF